ncbi:(R)-mandelonitrile lyase [Paraburkholderia phymatum]|uniref:(R)-mandelonitrile lyase n=1 Tax=Paraburkholderia phymatum TaxID=148447 RepID=UPI00059F9B14|nr:cupin domain-containing protein [Paraburkholderia phymatum]
MTITHSGAQASITGGSPRFTGAVRIDPLFQSRAPSRLSGGLVTFEPGARTAWHAHPLGQTLIVTSGRGWIQQCNRERQEIAAGDVISIPAGVKHWHGATSATGMTHIALQEALDGKNVDWLDQVTDEQYGKQ